MVSLGGDWAMQEIKGWIDVTIVWDGARRDVELYVRRSDSRNQSAS